MVKTSPFHGGNPSSNLGRVTKSGSIAQLGERLPYKQDVTGSSPVVPTKVVEKALFSVLFSHISVLQRLERADRKHKKRKQGFQYNDNLVIVI